MRARNLKPNFFKNEKLAEIPFETRLLFVGLWCMADREGRLEDRPKRIKAELFPYDSVNVEKMLDVITLHGFILRYEQDKERYIQIINFTKHQNPHPHEAKSIIPPMSLQAVKCHLPAGLIPSSLIPDVMNPYKHLARAFDFAKVYGQYPNRDSRKASEKHFHSSVKTEQDFLDIQTALQTYIKHLQSESWKQPQSAKTWFNNWRDWLNYKAPTTAAVTLPKPLRSPDPKPEELPTNEEIKQAKIAAGLVRGQP